MPYEKLKSENYKALGGINTKASQYITGEGEFLNLQNVDFRTVGALSSFAGSTLYSTVGSTSEIVGIQDYYKQVTTGYTLILGNTLAVTGVTTSIFATDAFHLNDVAGTTFQNLYTYIGPGNVTPTSFAFLNDSFGANSLDFWNYPGGTFPVWQYGIGKPTGPLGTITRSMANNGISGFLTLSFANVRQDGYIGPARSLTLQCTGETLISFAHYPTGPNLLVNTGLSYGSFGLSGIQVWIQLNQDTPWMNSALFAPGLNSGFSVGFAFTAGAGGWTVPTTLPQDFQGSFLYGPGQTQGAGDISLGYLNNLGSQPQMIESFFNQLFMALASRVYYSDIGTPEQSQYSNFFDVGLETTDAITLLKTYFTQLVIAKPTRVYALSGSGPSTFVLSLVSSEYGCISTRAACVWNQTFWFLDKKGIMEFNGANVIPTSNKLEDVFNRMNVSAASREAVMIHVKERNEVWTAIPVDGSTTNNLIVIYDYLANAWTTRTCPEGALTALATVTRGPTKETVFYGTSNGLIGTFGSSLVGDNGAAFTSVIKSRFIAPLGDSTTNMFRRLFLDAAVPLGATQNFEIRLYADHAATYAYATTMTLSAYQNRIDFGVAAKSLAVEFIFAGTTFVQFNGFTIESRFQRAV